MQVYNLLAIELDNDHMLSKPIIDRTTVLAQSDELAKQQFTINNAAKLKDKEVRIICKPF